MPKGKPYFAALPVRAICDARLTGLELRVLACICWHDRLSASKSGVGCFAGNMTMAAECGCTYSSLSRAIGVLVEAKYVQRDYCGVPGKRNLTVYRVDYGSPDDCPFGQQQVASLDNEAAQVVVRDDLNKGQSLARGSSETPMNSVASFLQETSLREGIDLAEAREETHLKVRVVPSRMLGEEKEVAEKAIATGGHLARFERAFRENPSNLDLEAWQRFIEQVLEEHETGDHEYGRAERLLELIDGYRDLTTWEANPGSDAPAADEPTLPDEGTLRATALAIIKSTGRGSQGMLAREAGINEGSFSTFLHQRVTLPGPSLARLNRALQQSKAA